MSFHTAIPFLQLPFFSLPFMINLAISSLIGGAIIWSLTKLFHEPPLFLHAVSIAFIANFMNYIVFIVLSTPFLRLAPLAAYIPIVVWIMAMKLFYGMRWGHAIIIGFLGWLSFTFAVPLLVTMARAYIAF